MSDGYLQEMRLQLSVLVFLLPTRLLLRSSLAARWSERFEPPRLHDSEPNRWSLDH